MRKLYAAALACAFAFPSTAIAGSRIFANPGQTIVFNGTVARDPNGNADPFTLQIYGGQGAVAECLRVALTAEQDDLEAVLISPSGQAWKNDDGFLGACPNCPVIKAITAPGRFGWYSLVVSKFDGLATQANFTVRISRLNPADALCASPTPPGIPGSEPASARK